MTIEEQLRQTIRILVRENQILAAQLEQAERMVLLAQIRGSRRVA